jgi:hypothetical protein
MAEFGNSIRLMKFTTRLVDLRNNHDTPLAESGFAGVVCASTALAAAGCSLQKKRSDC